MPTNELEMLEGEPTNEALRQRLLQTLPPPLRAEVSVEAAVVAVAGRSCIYYTRYSTDGQSELSTERQIEDADGYSERMNLSLVEKGIYSDEARSGFSMIGREALEELLKRVRRGGVEVCVIAECSRLARDSVDLVWLHRELARLNCELHSAREGKLDSALIHLYAIVSQASVELFLHNTYRARVAMLRELRIPWGARPFGFERDGHIPGKVKICENEKPIVLEIFKLVAEGVPYRRIALLLNTEGRLGRRKTPWDATSIARVINNVLYSGVIAYCRRKCVKDSSTRKVKQTMRSVNEWKMAFAKHLVIVDEALWNASRPRPRPEKDGQAERVEVGASLLCDLVRCPNCGRRMTLHGGSTMRGGRRYICSGYVRGRECSNGRSLSVAWTEAAVLGPMIEILDDRSLQEPYLRKLRAEAERAAADIAARKPDLQRRVDDLFAELKDTWDRNKTRGYPEEVIAAIQQDLTPRYRAAVAALEALGSPNAAVDVASRVDELGGLAQALRRVVVDCPVDVLTPDGIRLATAFHKLIKRIVPTPDPDSRGVCVRIDLAEMRFYDPKSAAGNGPVRTVRGRHVPPDLKELRRANARAGVDALLASGVCELADATWDAVSPLVPPAAIAALDPGRRDGRRLVEASLLVLRTSRNLEGMPESYGAVASVRAAVTKVFDSDAWARIASVLEAMQPMLLDGIDPARASYYHEPGKNKQGIPGGAPSRKRRAIIVEMLTRHGGATVAEVAAVTGQRPSTVRTAFSRLGLLGLEVTTAWRPDGRRSWHAVPRHGATLPATRRPVDRRTKERATSVCRARAASGGTRRLAGKAGDGTGGASRLAG